MASPPSYPLGSVAASQLDVSQTLPDYARTVSSEWDVPAADQLHHFHLARKTGERWLTLTMTSRAATAEATPLFFQGGNVTGSLKLHLEKEELVDEISIDLYGRLTIFSHSTSNFLRMAQNTYSAADKPPESLEPSLTTAKRGRLKGRYDWPYSFRLPKGVSILSSITPDGESERKSYRLPPSFRDEQSNVDVQYSLVVRVNRGGFRKANKLVVPFDYVPLARPSPPTILRQLAYQQDAEIVGPEGDPEGWKSFDPIKIEGVLFKKVPVKALCRLSVARPLTYTRGTPIHLMMCISSDNEQLLDLLTPQSIYLVVVQRTTFGDDNRPLFSRRLSAQITVKSQIRATAKWWKFSSSNPAPSTRAFAGELLVPADLPPACQILHYGHEYEFAFTSLSAVGFTPTAPSKNAFLTEPINIVTAFSQGARPRSYIPPEYNIS
ncbi:hypothetical protein GSI_02357 [Ganoderma sinense ZZ0214-1]|uniref:Arrestin-like N-terminal domain-containing protein n=1 Tax=Ganoderma sinense ZZ0214-1 TaxID=1077348 RepID=A0A2G8SPD4_9APHY|nr:hypothetical protein GSI_02357 [Ganoderma sinense ZZ0214-1]